MSDPGKVSKHQLEELGLPKPLDEFEVVDDSSNQVSPQETLLSRPEVAEVAAQKALQETVARSQESGVRSQEVVDEAVIENKQVQNEQISKSANEQKANEQLTANNSQLTTTPDPEIKKIEDIMAKGLEDEYKKLTPTLQEKFRTQGEETAGKIAKLLKAAHVNIKKIISLLRSWLRIIPHVNKYFLEQEAKIKADELVKGKL